MAVKEVKVGQVWKWYEWSDVSFEVLEIIGNKVGIRYTGKQHSTRVNLDYWDDESVLVEDVPVEDEPTADEVSHPSHYTSDPSGVECIQITRHRNFNVGNAFKYLWRAGLKEDADLSAQEKEIQDLKKARWYIDDEIARLEGK